MKIVSTGRTISTSEYLAKKQKARRKRLVTLSVLLGLLIIGMIIVLRLPQLQVRAVSVSGATVTGEDMVKERAERILSGNYLWLVPHSNALFYRKDHMREELSREFPRFSSIDISLDNFKTLNISVTEREPFALYCLSGVASAESGESAEKCFFIDKEGFIFDEAPSFSEGVYLIFSHEPLLIEPLGQFMIERQEFLYFKDFLEFLRSLGFKPLSTLISSEDASIRLSGGGMIILGRRMDLQRTKINLEAFLSSPTIFAQQDFLSRVGELDLRTEDKVFWKLK